MSYINQAILCARQNLETYTNMHKVGQHCIHDAAANYRSSLLLWHHPSPSSYRGWEMWDFKFLPSSFADFCYNIYTCIIYIPTSIASCPLPCHLKNHESVWNTDQYPFLMVCVWHHMYVQSCRFHLHGIQLLSQQVTVIILGLSWYSSLIYLRVSTYMEIWWYNNHPGVATVSV